MIPSVEMATSAKFRNLPFANEDLAGWQGNTFWLLDGAGTPERHAVPEAFRLPVGTLVYWVDQAFRDQLLQMPHLPLDLLLRRVESQLSLRLAAHYAGCPEEALRRGTPHTTLALVRRHAESLEYALLPDSSLLVLDQGMVLTLKDERQDEFNDAYYTRIEEVLREGDAFGRRYNAVLDAMADRERELRNETEGFYTFTGLPGVAEHVVHGRLGLSADATVVLASDGAARWWSVFQQPKDILAEGSLTAVLQQLRELEHADAQGLDFPRIGRHDDATFLRLHGLP